MLTLDRSGVSLHYEDRGRGPAILLSHGFGATSQMWAGQVADLAPDHRVLTWDLRGHGRSGSPEALEDYSRSAAVEDMRALLDACRIERAVIGGLSLGGYLSLAFHLVYPERVRGLMLFDTGPGYKNPKARDAWNRGAERMAREIETRGMVALAGGAEVNVSAHRSAVGLARAARGTLAQFDSRVAESLGEIRVPTLVLAGERDEPFLAATDYMASKIPHATRVLIPEAGHAANIDRPREFNRAVRSFLSTLD